MIDFGINYIFNDNQKKVGVLNATCKPFNSDLLNIVAKMSYYDWQQHREYINLLFESARNLTGEKNEIKLKIDEYSLIGAKSVGYLEKK